MTTPTLKKLLIVILLLPHVHHAQAQELSENSLINSGTLTMAAMTSAALLYTFGPAVKEYLFPPSFQERVKQCTALCFDIQKTCNITKEQYQAVCSMDSDKLAAYIEGTRSDFPLSKTYSPFTAYAYKLNRTITTFKYYKSKLDDQHNKLVQTKSNATDQHKKINIILEEKRVLIDRYITTLEKLYKNITALSSYQEEYEVLVRIHGIKDDRDEEDEFDFDDNDNDDEREVTPTYGLSDYRGGDEVDKIVFRMDCGEQAEQEYKEDKKKNNEEKDDYIDEAIEQYLGEFWQ